MAENEQNMITKNTELNLFKDEVLKKIRDLETKLTSKITSKELVLNSDYQSFTSKLNLLINNNKELSLTIAAQKVKLDKVSELEAFKNKVDSMLISHEFRIKNNSDEIGKIKTKYDKIVADNLYVTGHIGSACQFRNLSEYLSFSIAEASRLKMENDQLKKDIRDIKNKWDGIMKSMMHMNDTTAKLCNNYTDNKQQYFQKALEHTQKELDQKSLDMRAVMTKYQNDSDQKLIELREEVNKLIQSESNINNLINDNFYICERQREEIKKNISESEENITNHKTILKDLDNKIKSLEEKIKSLYGLSSKVTRLYDIVENNRSNNFNNTNNNNVPRTISQSPPPIRMQRENSNPELIKKNSDMANMNSLKIGPNENKIKYAYASSKRIIQRKNIQNIEAKKLNFNLGNSINISNTEEPNKSKEIKEIIKETKEIEEKPKKIKLKINKKDEINNKSIEKTKANIKIVNFGDIPNDKEKEKEKKPQITQKTNQSNAIQTLPLLTPTVKKSNLKQVIIKPNFTDTNESNNNSIQTITNKNTINNNKNKNLPEKRNTSVNNITPQISNDLHTQTETQINNSNLNLNTNKMKKIGAEIDPDNPRLTMVSLNLSQSTTKDAKGRLSKSKRPPKLKYDIVNTLINEYRAKAFSRGISKEINNERKNNNDIVDMPKRVSQAFGRTTYTFFFKKDVMNAAYANKNVNNFGYDGPTRGYNYSKTVRHNNENFSLNFNNNNNTNNNDIKNAKDEKK